MDLKIPLTLILPHAADDSSLNRTLESLLPTAQVVQLIATTPNQKLSSFPRAVTIPGEPPQGLAELINRALPTVEGEFLAVAAPGLEISPELPKWLQELADDHSYRNYVYGDYHELDGANRRSVEANPCPEDITEREDWGPLEIYRTQGLRDLGGVDSTRRFRADYDLRLKLTDHHPAIHIRKTLCSVPKPQNQSEAASAALFFPGRGKFGGFSYLFLDPNEEREIEEIFLAALQRRGAFLAGPPGGVFPAPLFTSPRVSVVMPVHNRASFLPLSVGSVQHGTFQDFEIIIVDNASTDDTLAVARDLALRDPRLSVLSLPDNVIAKALNAGIRAARGEYIAQLDSDDEYVPQTLTVMVRHLDEHPEEALAISYYELMDPEGITLAEFGVIKHLEYNRNNILRVDGAGALRCWRRAAIMELGGFNEDDFGHYGEDYDLVLKAGEIYEVGRVHEVLYRYRRHPGNSDALRAHSLKINNKTLARQRAIGRRQEINQREE
jgi:hypothetical protein